MKKIPLSQDKFAFIDDQDFDLVSGFHWHAVANRNKTVFYAVTHIYKDGKRTTLQMHRLLLGDQAKCLFIDHIDMNGLNNSRLNLRTCTHSQNMQNKGPKKNNKSGFKGVIFHPITKTWTARIMVNKKAYSLGYHKTPELAHAAYCKAAKELHREFARTS